MLAVSLLAVIALRAGNFIENFSLNLLTELIGALIVLYLIEGRIARASEDMKTEARLANKTLNSMLQAWERGEVPESKVIESNQWVSWHKWIYKEDITGWAELLEAARHGTGLSEHIRSVIEWELGKVRQRAYEAGGFSTKDEELEAKLQALLHPSSE